MTLCFDDVGAAYGRRVVFAGVTFTIEAGEVVGLIGPNGAGKTTMLRMAAGLVRPVTGQIERAGLVMYFGGEATLPPRCRVDRWSALTGAASRDRRPFRRLSRGTRQLAGLRAWLSRDDWAIGLLDEPWEGLDPDGARWLCDEIGRHRRRGAAVLVSSHRLHDVAQACSSYALLSGGALDIVRAADIGSSAGGITAADLARVFEQRRHAR